MRPRPAALLLTLLALVACSDDSPQAARQGGPTPLPAASATTGPAAASSSVEGDIAGARVRLDVEPLQRRPDSTLLQARLTVLSGEANLFEQFATRTASDRDSLGDVRLVLPELGLLASPARGADDEPVTSALGGVELGGGQSAGLQVLFGPLPAEAGSADVLWPLLGVVPGVPVSDDAPGPLAGFGEEQPRPAEGAPVRAPVLPLSGRVDELAGAVRTAQDPQRTRVAVASDVLFALDSDQLGPDAQAALERAAAQVLATGAGPVQVVGHTDDQGTDAYNDDLSRRRAGSVATALAGLLPPDRFPPSVQGRGESEPAVLGTDAAARAANRRVEVVVERAQDAGRPATGQQPPPVGPQAAAAEGLVLPVDGGSLRLRAAQAVPVGDWLRLELVASVEQAEQDDVAVTVDLRADDRPGTVVNDASGIGVLDGDRRLLAALAEDGTCACPNTLFGIDLAPGQERAVPVYVRAPASLGSTVDVELPEGLGRLVGVPVGAAAAG